MRRAFFSRHVASIGREIDDNRGHNSVKTGYYILSVKTLSKHTPSKSQAVLLEIVVK